MMQKAYGILAGLTELLLFVLGGAALIVVAGLLI
jgi:hypothetical protein